jgi:hypothetical protein
MSGTNLFLDTTIHPHTTVPIGIALIIIIIIIIIGEEEKKYGHGLSQEYKCRYPAQRRYRG